MKKIARTKPASAKREPMALMARTGRYEKAIAESMNNLRRLEKVHLDFPASRSCRTYGISTYGNPVARTWSMKCEFFSRDVRRASATMRSKQTKSKPPGGRVLMANFFMYTQNRLARILLSHGSSRSFRDAMTIRFPSFHDSTICRMSSGGSCKSAMMIVKQSPVAASRPARRAV